MLKTHQVVEDGVGDGMETTGGPYKNRTRRWEESTACPQRSVRQWDPKSGLLSPLYIL